MEKIDTNLYDKHFSLLKKYYKKIDIYDEEYRAFIFEKYCEVVHRYYTKEKNHDFDYFVITPEKYLWAAFKDFKNEYIKEQVKNKMITVDPEKLDTFIADEGAGYINKNSPIFESMDRREISFLLYCESGDNYKDIAKDFRCSEVTVKRVAAKAKNKLRHNAQKMGYKI